jgi:hypothetical protein
VKKTVLTAAVAACAMLLTSAASPAPNVSARETPMVGTNKLQTIKVQRVVYRCWTYDTAGGTWYGTHRNVARARSLAMMACRGNLNYVAVCYHNTYPCEEFYQ